MEDRYQRYQNTAFTSQQWYIIKKAIDEDIEVKDIADPRFSVEQLTLLIDARRSGIDLSGLTDPDIKEEQLKQILEKIANEMGLYDEHYEKVRRKWLRNITWMLLIGSVLTIIVSLLYVTKDEWLKYFEELYLSFDRETVQLEAGEPFEPASYIRSYDPEAVITFPNRDEIDTKKPGTYWAVYHISNGKKEKDMKLLVEVKDTKAPVISLNRSSVTVSDRSDLKAKDYIDSVMDIVDGDLLSKTTTKSCSGYRLFYRRFDFNSRHVKRLILSQINRIIDILITLIPYGMDVVDRHCDIDTCITDYKSNGLTTVLPFFYQF